MSRTWTPAERTRACDEILAQVEKGKGLNTVCTQGDDWIPTESTFRYWCDNDPDLAAKYARARDVRADHHFEEILSIVDDSTLKSDAVAQGAARLKIDARKWMVGKMNPRKYGDKIDVNHGGAIKVEGVTMSFVDASDTADS